VIEKFETRARDAEQQAHMIRELLMSRKINGREKLD
jgi:hypothetical protein